MKRETNGRGYVEVSGITLNTIKQSSIFYIIFHVRAILMLLQANQIIDLPS